MLDWRWLARGAYTQQNISSVDAKPHLQPTQRAKANGCFSKWWTPFWLVFKGKQEDIITILGDYYFETPPPSWQWDAVGLHTLRGSSCRRAFAREGLCRLKRPKWLLRASTNMIEQLKCLRYIRFRFFQIQAEISYLPGQETKEAIASIGLASSCGSFRGGMRKIVVLPLELWSDTC